MLTTIPTRRSCYEILFVVCLMNETDLGTWNFIDKVKQHMFIEFYLVFGSKERCKSRVTVSAMLRETGLVLLAVLGCAVALPGQTRAAGCGYEASTNIQPGHVIARVHIPQLLHKTTIGNSGRLYPKKVPVFILNDPRTSLSTCSPRNNNVEVVYYRNFHAL